MHVGMRSNVEYGIEIIEFLPCVDSPSVCLLIELSLGLLELMPLPGVSLYCFVVD